MPCRNTVTRQGRVAEVSASVDVRHRAGDVHHAAVGDALLDVRRGGVGGRSAGLDAALVDGDVNDDAAWAASSGASRASRAGDEVRDVAELVARERGVVPNEGADDFVGNADIPQQDLVPQIRCQPALQQSPRVNVRSVRLTAENSTGCRARSVAADLTLKT